VQSGARLHRSDSAVALIRITPRAAGFHHNLGQCAAPPQLPSVEAPASGVVVRQVSAAHACALAHANHLLGNEFRSVVQTISPSSAARQTRAMQLAANSLPNSDAALAVFTDENNAEWPIRRKRRGSNDPGFTLASAVFDLRKQHLHWRVFDDPKNPPLFEQTMAIPASQ
jgi:hypothetical protein